MTNGFVLFREIAKMNGKVLTEDSWQLLQNLQGLVKEEQDEFQQFIRTVSFKI